MVDTTQLPPPPPPGYSLPPPPVGPPPGVEKSRWYRRPWVLLTVLGVVVVLVAGVILAVTQGGGGGSSGSADKAASWLPQPAVGKATIGGKLTVNGTPRANESVTLLASGEDKVKVETTTDGSFVFPDVAPGSYAIIVSVWVANANADSSGGILNMNWDKPCSAAGFDTLNTGATSRSNGETGVIAVASNEGGTGHSSHPFTVGAGDRHAQDVAFVCDIG